MLCICVGDSREVTVVYSLLPLSYMNNETVTTYISTERARGVADEEIRGALLAQGWPEDIVSNGIGNGATSTLIKNTHFSFSHLFEGRLMRWQYFLTSFLFGFAVCISMIFIALLGYMGESVILFICMGLIYLIAFPVAFSLSIRRLHDLNWSGWCILLNFIPIVNVVMALLLLFMKGSDGPNKYGIVQSDRNFINTLLNK